MSQLHLHSNSFNFLCDRDEGSEACAASMNRTIQRELSGLFDVLVHHIVKGDVSLPVTIDLTMITEHWDHMFAATITEVKV